jgi:hypothetical protein
MLLDAILLVLQARCPESTLISSWFPADIYNLIRIEDAKLAVANQRRSP